MFNLMIFTMHAFEEHVFFGYQNCNAMVVMRRSDQCVSLVTPADREVAFGDSFITSIDQIERRLLVGTNDGTLYETVLP